jgi:hypothetical protein
MVGSVSPWGPRTFPLDGYWGFCTPGSENSHCPPCNAQLRVLHSPLRLNDVVLNSLLHNTNCEASRVGVYAI